MKKKQFGFTFVEVLAVIFIVSIVMVIGGRYIFSIINSSEKKSEIVALANIKKTARFYVEEFPEGVVWKEKTGTDNTYSCVAVSSLVNKGYLKNEEVEEFSLNNYIVVTKDSNQAILSLEFDDGEFCGDLEEIVPIPTSKDFCANPTYNGGEQTLTVDISSRGLNFYFDEVKETNAGNYTVTAHLSQSDFIWEDGTKDTKEITCSIKKAPLQLQLDSMGNSGTVIGDEIIHLTSNVGGKVTLKSSNKDHVVASLVNKNIDKNTQLPITISTLASRNTTTYVTITVTPSLEDAKNYYSGSIVYTIGKVELVGVSAPDNSYCKNLTYTGYDQILTNNPKTGTIFYNNKAINAGNYVVTARLKYGYYWEGRSEENKYDRISFTCSIKKAKPTLTLSPTSGEVMKTKNISTTFKSNLDGSFTVVSGNTNYVGIVKPTGTTGVKANQTSTIEMNGKEVTSSNIPITINFTPLDQENYQSVSTTYNLKVKTNQFTLTYNSNGGNACSPSTKTIVYGNSYGTLCTPTRTGYNFSGWYTAASGGSQVTSSTVTTGNVTIYAHWSVKTVVVTFYRNHSSSDTTTTKQTFTYGKTGQSFNSGFSRTGYSALGWSTSRSATTATYSFKSGVADSWINTNSPSITLYAVWKDDIKPTCTTSKSNTNTTSGVTVKVTCSDSGSGCTSGSTTYKGVKKNTTYTVKDKAGNSGTCKVSISSYKQYRYIQKYSKKTCPKGGKIYPEYSSSRCCKNRTSTGGSYIYEGCYTASTTKVCGSSYGSWGGSSTGCSSQSRTLYK